jgi:hypothetical protein
LLGWAAPALAQPVPPPPEPAASVAPLPAAATVPANLSLTVTGSPAGGAFLEDAIRGAVDRAIRPTLRPGASMRFGPIVPWPIPPLAAGERMAVAVSVTVAGDAQTAWVTGVTTVDVTNVPTMRAAPSVLLLSDDPEYVQSDGPVFRGRVEPGKSARLYYYHSNIGLPRDIDVLLTAQTAARVHVIQSRGGPDRDVMAVGHAVSRDFLLREQQNEGTIVNLVPGAPYVVRHDLMLQGELVAGAVDVSVLGGGPVGVAVVASPAGGTPAAYLSLPRVPFDGHRRHGAFELDGFGELSATYTVGGPDAAVRYGGAHPSPKNVDPSDAGRDLGDYGIVHRVTFTLVNPTDAAVPVYLYEKPLGGPVRSTFFVDGQMKEVGCARLAQPYWFMTYQLAPHSSAASTTLTMTDGGSYYPIEFGVSATPPVAYTPPVGSADGCSPLPTPSPSPVPTQPPTPEPPSPPTSPAATATPGG